MKPGDRVCVCYGVDTPFILRPSPEDGLYTVVGESYVHGLMDGEAAVLREGKHIGDEEFVIQ